MEAFGVATALLQVADTGSLLAKNLYKCAQDIKGANSDLCGIASEVDLTSKILQNFGSLLNDETTGALCSAQLCADAKEALEGCQAAFDDLNNRVATFRKPQDRVRITRAARVKWPLTKSKMKEHQERLERLKSSLNLMLQMLHFAKSTKSGTSSQDTAQKGDRAQLENLIRTNEALVRTLTLEPEPSHIRQAPTRDVMLRVFDAPAQGSRLTQSVRAARPDSARQDLSKDAVEADRISRQLQACVQASVKLTQSLQVAVAEWHETHIEPLQSFEPPFQHLCQDVSILRGLLHAFSATHTSTQPSATSSAQYSLAQNLAGPDGRRYSGGHLQSQAPASTIRLGGPHASLPDPSMQRAMHSNRRGLRDYTHGHRNPIEVDVQQVRPAKNLTNTHPMASTGTCGEYLGIEDFPGEGKFHVFADGCCIPTQVDGEQVNPAWGLVKANKPRKRLAMACPDCRMKKIKCDHENIMRLQFEKAVRTRVKNTVSGYAIEKGPYLYDNEDLEFPKRVGVARRESSNIPGEPPAQTEQQQRQQDVRKRNHSGDDPRSPRKRVRMDGDNETVPVEAASEAVEKLWQRWILPLEQLGYLKV